MQAIFNGDPDEVRALIFKKEDVNFQVKQLIHWFIAFKPTFKTFFLKLGFLLKRHNSVTVVLNEVKKHLGAKKEGTWHIFREMTKTQEN